MTPDGRTTRFLALGPISGDWGGGDDLGQEALWWAARAEDGRGPQTALRDRGAPHFGVATVRDVALGLHRDKIGRDELRLAPVLLEPPAGTATRSRGTWCARQADEVCVMALAAMRRLGLDGAAVPVVLGGGVLTARDPLLTGRSPPGWRRGARAAVPRIVDVPPVAGAALLGLDQAGAGPAPRRGCAPRSRRRALRLTAWPGVSPVSWPSRSAKRPLTSTWWMPRARRGFA